MVGYRILGVSILTIDNQHITEYIDPSGNFSKGLHGCSDCLRWPENQCISEYTDPPLSLLFILGAFLNPKTYANGTKKISYEHNQASITLIQAGIQ